MDKAYQQYNFVKATYSKNSTSLAFYEYPNGDVVKGKGGRRVSEEHTDPDAYLLRKAKNDASTLHRRTQKIHELMRNNFSSDNCIFLTLTYNPALLEESCYHTFTAKHPAQEWSSLSNDAKDNLVLETVNKDFQNYIRTLKYSYNGIAYLGIIERQQNGTPHIHFIINILDEELLKDKWQYGITDARPVFDIGGLACYFCKQVKSCKPYAHAILKSQHLKPSISVRNWHSEENYMTVKETVQKLHRQPPDRVCSCYNLHTKGLVYETYYNTPNDSFDIVPVASRKPTASKPVTRN